jgi:hypothetical protein
MAFRLLTQEGYRSIALLALDGWGGYRSVALPIFRGQEPGVRGFRLPTQDGYVSIAPPEPLSAGRATDPLPSLCFRPGSPGSAALRLPTQKGYGSAALPMFQGQESGVHGP